MSEFDTGIVRDEPFDRGDVELIAVQIANVEVAQLLLAAPDLLEACKAAELAIDLAGSACADTETDKRCGECTGCLLYAALTMSRAAIKGHS